MSYNVKCPKGYGEINFKNDGRCPVSGTPTCEKCDMVPMIEFKDEVRSKKGKVHRD